MLTPVCGACISAAAFEIRLQTPDKMFRVRWIPWILDKSGSLSRTASIGVRGDQDDA